jgi:penicillin-binding protein 1B
MVKSVRDARGAVLNNYHSDGKTVLDPRVAYVMTTMMEAVVNSGTGYPVRARGFEPPAAGKTGTSHDAWFAGYTTNLLCVVWVGNDDYTDIKLAGGAAAAPIWAEFMKRAVRLPQYADVKDFQQPSGVVQIQLDKVTNRLATPSCPEDYTVAFIAGTEPKETCDQSAASSPPTQASPNGDPVQAQQAPPKRKKKGLFSKLFGKGDSGDEQQNSGAGTTENGNNPSPK